MLLHPALRDSAGCAAEALRIGKPLLCLDLGTPVLLMDENSGIRVPISDVPGTVRGLADAMRRMATDGAFYEQLRKGSLERDRHITREARGREVLDLYRRVLTARRPGPIPTASPLAPAVTR